MTEVIYYSDSISKVVTVFAIECAIVFGFIIFLMFCCIGKLFGSNDISVKNKDVFTFKKYSSKNKISDSQIETLYQSDMTKTKDKTNNENKQCSKSIGTKLYDCIFTSSNTDIEKNHPKAKIKQKNNSSSSLSCSITNIECNLQEKSPDCKIDNYEKINKTNEDKETYNIDETDNGNKTVKLDETKTIDDVKDLDILTDKENNELDIEQGLSANKIYLVYEFNNLDKTANSTSYIETVSADEFDELEEFVNMVIKSFKTKYDNLGILLKISSPGGSAFKFEHAYSNLMRLKRKNIELIGLVDKMAASGGYMLASACDKIVCDKYATIGSIGVIAQLYNWSELSKKVGLEEKTWITGSHKNPFPMGSAYTEEDNQRMKEMIGETFDIFKSIVMETRKFTPEQMEEIGKAKTFPGFKALELNMVDCVELSSDYMDNLSLTNNVWICIKEKKSKSLFNSLSMDMDLKSIGINLISKVHNQFMVDKKINGIKLM